MRRNATERTSGPRVMWWSGTASLLVLTCTTGCLRAREDHCIFTGGDYTEGIGPHICVVLQPNASRASMTDENGYFEVERGQDAATVQAPEGHRRVRYGVPRALGRQDTHDRQTVVGVVEAALGHSTANCAPINGLEIAWLGGAGGIGDFYATLDHEALTRSSRVQLPLEELEPLERAIEAYIDQCEGPSSGTTSTGTATDATDDTHGDQTGSSTGPDSCESNAECPPLDPYCDADGTCRPCNAAPDPAQADATCAMANEATPICADGVCVQCSSAMECAGDTPICADGICVQCTPDDAAACDGETPTCGEDNACGPCTHHDQCGAAACNLFTGACLPDTAQTVVRVGGIDGDYPTLSDAVAAYPPGAAGLTIILRQDGDYMESIVVESGMTVAVLADRGHAPVWSDPPGGASQLHIADGTVLIDGIAIVDNTSNTNAAARVNAGRLWIDRGRITRNQAGAIAADNGSELVVRNSFLGGDIKDKAVVLLLGSKATLLYSTVIGGGGMAAALACIASDVELRNSVAAARAGTSEIQCPAAVVESTATEMVLPGTNVSVGALETAWFIDFAAGDFHLSALAPAALATIGRWQPGDPRVDIDGTEVRPAGPDDTDYAGADVP